MNQFDIQDSKPERSFTSSYTRLDQQPSVSGLSSVHQQKMEMVHQFFEALLASFILTFGVLSSDNNTLGILLIFFISALVAQQPTVFNPAVTLMETLQGIRSVRTFWIQITGQLMGSLVGTAFCLLAQRQVFSDDNLTPPPYWDSTFNNDIIGQLYGEIIGAFIFISAVLIQEDDYLKFSDDHLEHAGIIAIAFGAGRQFSYKSNSLFNPALAFSFEFFECLYDNNWSRLGFLWIFIAGPIAAGFLSLMFVNMVYRPCYDRKLKNGL